MNAGKRRCRVECAPASLLARGRQLAAWLQGDLLAPSPIGARDAGEHEIYFSQDSLAAWSFGEDGEYKYLPRPHPSRRPVHTSLIIDHLRATTTTLSNPSFRQDAWRMLMLLRQQLLVRYCLHLRRQ